MAKNESRATVVDYIFNDAVSFEEKKLVHFRKESHENLKLPLKIVSFLIAIAGLFSMIFEVRHFEQFAMQVYIVRLSATVISFLILFTLSTSFSKKNPVFLVHVLLLTIIFSSGYMILLIPSTLIVNSQIVGLMIFTSALFLSWDLKNQIFVAIYYNIVFAGAILMNDRQIYFLPNMYESVLFVLFLSVVSVIGSTVNYKLRRELAAKSFLVKLSERKFRSIFEHSAEGVFQTSPEGKFLTANPAILQILGYASEQEIKLVDVGKDVYVRRADRDKLLYILQHKGEVSNYRLELKRKDGRHIIARLNDRLVREDGGDKYYFEGSIQDITEQVLLERSQKNIQEELKQEKLKSEKLADEAVKSSEIKSQFLANMSHEIRTPINGIIGFLTLIENKSYKNNEELADFIGTARSSAESLLDLVNDILDFSKIEAGKMELYETGFSIQKVINDALSTISPRVNEKRLTVNINIDRHIPATLLGDSTRLRQILINLLSNAVKFTPAGDITVSVFSERIATEKVMLTFSVKDSGVGIPQEKIASLFQPFSQVDGTYTRKHGGTGLGLVICRELVGMMNGSIWVESELNRGSTFSFTCVLKFERQTSFLDKLKGKATPEKVIPPEMLAKIMQHESVRSERRKFHILVAEDNPVNMKVVVRILDDAGYNVDSAVNGKIALENVQQNADKFDLVLMDIQMPEMDGFTATQQIRMLNSSAAKLPVIALTAHATPADREKCLAAGMDDYLTKPIKNQELISMLDKWLQIDYSAAKSTGQSLQVESQPPPAGNVIIQPENIPGAETAQVPEPSALYTGFDPAKVFDLVHFKSVSLDDPDFKKELLSTYLEDTLLRMSALDRHIASGNLQGVVSEAHTIKGASYSVGAVLMGDKAKEIEFAGKNKQTENLQQFASELMKHYELFREAAREEAGL